MHTNDKDLGKHGNIIEISDQKLQIFDRRLKMRLFCTPDPVLLNTLYLHKLSFHLNQQENGFEQFVINYVNEKFHQVLVELTLKIEQVMAHT